MSENKDKNAGMGGTSLTFCSTDQKKRKEEKIFPKELPNEQKYAKIEI
jgi:hypothetical protein